MCISKEFRRSPLDNGPDSIPVQTNLTNPPLTSPNEFPWHKGIVFASTTCEYFSGEGSPPNIVTWQSIEVQDQDGILGGVVIVEGFESGFNKAGTRWLSPSKDHKGYSLPGYEWMRSATPEMAGNLSCTKGQFRSRVEIHSVLPPGPVVPHLSKLPNDRAIFVIVSKKSFG